MTEGVLFGWMQRVTQVLDNKGVLSRLKVSRCASSSSAWCSWAVVLTLVVGVQAELRANVFLAINDQDIQNGGVGQYSQGWLQLVKSLQVLSRWLAMQGCPASQMAFAGSNLWLTHQASLPVLQCYAIMQLVYLTHKFCLFNPTLLSSNSPCLQVLSLWSWCGSSCTGAACSSLCR